MKPNSLPGVVSLLTAVGVIISAHAAGSDALPANITAAIADPMRPETDTKRDADRKAGQSLAFADIKPGQHVVDFLPGGGYFTRLFSAAVGPTGVVYAVAPPGRPGAAPDAPPPAAPVIAIAADPHYGNVVVLVERARQFAIPGSADLVWTSRNYHDLHNVPDLNVVDFDKAVLNALKPGGFFIVLDHSAEAGSGFRDTNTLHRIDVEAVKKEVVSAGFIFEGSSEILANKDDPRTGKVWEPPIKDHTDQFILKFRKPAK